MIIAGLTGGIGHGKTTFANLLNQRGRLARHFETWELIAEVANALRSENTNHPLPHDIAAINNWLVPLADIVGQCMHVSIKFSAVKLTPERLQQHPQHYAKLFEYLQLVQVHPELASIDIDDVHKQDFRSLLQWLGGFLVVIAGSGVWYDELLRRIAQQQVRGSDLVTVGGVRYPADAERLRNAGGIIIEIQRPSLPQQDAHDLTERERNLIEPECIVVNNGTLADLATCAATVYSDLCRRQLAATYTATVASDSPVRPVLHN